MKVAEIWRYPVKSMAGERLGRARIGALGIEGDRVVHVETPILSNRITACSGASPGNSAARWRSTAS